MSHFLLSQFHLQVKIILNSCPMLQFDNHRWSCVRPFRILKTSVFISLIFVSCWKFLICLQSLHVSHSISFVIQLIFRVHFLLVAFDGMIKCQKITIQRVFETSKSYKPKLREKCSKFWEMEVWIYQWFLEISEKLMIMTKTLINIDLISFLSKNLTVIIPTSLVI